MFSLQSAEVGHRCLEAFAHSCKVRGEMDEQVTGKKANAFFQRVAQELMPDLEKAIVSICWFFNDDIGLDRTGVLFQVGESHFLLTASHGIKTFFSDNIPLFYSRCFS